MRVGAAGTFLAFGCSDRKAERWRARPSVAAPTELKLSLESVALKTSLQAILDRKDYAAWLDPVNDDRDMLQSLLVPFPADRMKARPVRKQGASVSRTDAR